MVKQDHKAMSTMIHELKVTDNNLNDEQQVQVIILFLLDSWEHMRVIVTQNKNIKTSNDLSHLLKLLEVEHLEAEKVTKLAMILIWQKMACARHLGLSTREMLSSEEFAMDLHLIKHRPPSAKETSMVVRARLRNTIIVATKNILLRIALNQKT